jgi:kinesin family protein 18/19
MAIDGASSIQVTIRVRPFTIREAAQLSRSDEGPLFLGDGSLAAVPTPKLGSKGIRSVIKVVDEKCL